MPVYKCYAPKNSMSSEDRSRVAEGITEVHCKIIGVPPFGVHVVFFDNTDDGNPGGVPYFIHGINRAGRSPEFKQRILEGLTANFSETTGVSLSKISGTIEEIPASHFMELGVIVPEPGQEPAEWHTVSAAAKG